MKKSALLLFLLPLWGMPAVAQTFGYVDLEFILSKVPEYATAQNELNAFSEKWAKDIQNRYSEIDRLQRALMAEEVLLTDDLKQRRRNEIREKELEVREYNNKVFGMNGMLFEKKKEAIKPSMEKVQRAVDKVCTQRKLNFMFDKSSDMVMLYSDPRYDFTDYVLDELGIDLKAKANEIKPTESPKVKATPPGRQTGNNSSNTPGNTGQPKNE